MTTTTVLRALADHLDRHPQLDERLLDIRVDTDRGRPATLHLFGDTTEVPVFLDGYDTLAAGSVTACLFNTSTETTVFLDAHGLVNDVPVQIEVICYGTTADLLRANFQLTDKPVAIPVHQLRALVSAEAAEHIERPIVDPQLVGTPAASAEVDPCADLQPGDLLLKEHQGDCPADGGWYGCARAKGHPGQHMSTHPDNRIRSVWPQDGAS